jgi:dethiobiotin synthase
LTLAIVGTGTGVGKTLVAATVLARYGAEMPLAYWKPVATGSREDRDTVTIAALAGDRAVVLAESYLFPEPLSPHLAARLAGSRIEPATLLADFDRHRAAHPALVIETAGGLLVPLAGGEEVGDGVAEAAGREAGENLGEAGRDLGESTGVVAEASAAGAPDRRAAGRRIGAGGRPPGLAAKPAGAARGWPFRGSPAAAPPAAPAAWPAGAPPVGYLQADLLADMARRDALACLVVSHSGLGTINHTLLTLEALRARGLAIAGVALDGPPNRENRLAIQRFGRVDAIFELPHFAPIDREEVAGVARFFDHGGRLAPLLRVGGPHGSTGGGAGERPRRASPV